MPTETTVQKCSRALLLVWIAYLVTVGACTSDPAPPPPDVPDTGALADLPGLDDATPTNDTPDDPGSTPTDRPLDSPRAPDVALSDRPADASGCTHDRDCAAPTGHCLTDQRRCVECRTGVDCVSGQACASNRCVTPTSCVSSRMCIDQVCDAARSVCVDCVGDVDCPSGQVCRANSCVTPPRPCRSSRECSELNLVCDPVRGHCVECAMDVDCTTDQLCSTDGSCAPRRCTPSSRTCTSASRVSECDARGATLTERDCPAGTACVMGACMARTCTPGEASCTSLAERRVCNADGFGYTTTACMAGQSCVMGVCMARVCTPGEASCASMTERRVCNMDGLGYTTMACTAPVGQSATCVAGACRIACAAGFADCDGNTANGCEISLNTDANNCGRCANACPRPANTSPLCITGGMCGILCLTGFGDCDMNPVNGCEAAFTADTNCGSCSVRCATTEACSGGRCVPRPTCIPPLRSCGASCVDLRSNPSNCGACGVACPTGQACVLGRCAPSSECNPTRGLEFSISNVCRLRNGDGANCSGPNSYCGFGLDQVVCAGSGCAAVCPQGMTQCGRDCANLALNPAHCGRCDNRCLPGQVCYDGACVAAGSCTRPLVSCGASCVDLRSNPSNCGACGTACPTGQACVLGRCAPTSECSSSRGLELASGNVCRLRNGDGANCSGPNSYCGFGLDQVVCAGSGCAAVCPQGMTQCGRDCANLALNPAHCGRCDNRCLPGQVCYDGACVAAGPCTRPLVSCGASCVDLRSNPSNCGACGTACPTGQTCVLGRCAPTSECSSSRGLELASGNVCRLRNGDGANCSGPNSYCGFGLDQVVCAGSGCAAVCPQGMTQCGRDCANLALNPAHCGRCDNRCLPGQVCYDGACVAAGPCTRPLVSCGANCVDLRSNPSNCGACGTACPTGQACVLGRCAPSSECNPTRGLEFSISNVCRLRNGDGANCSGPNSYCGFGLDQVVCAGSGCAAVCPQGMTQCGRDCANLALNPAHCGRCDNRCLPGQVCYDGACVAAGSCTRPLVSCGASCVDLRSNPSNCGACGAACPTGQACVLGRCAPTSECSSSRGLELASGNVCRLRNGDGANCSGPNSYCGFGLDQVVCAGSGCAAVCPQGMTQCGRDCANLALNPAHCGRCDNRCLPGQVCYNAACITP